MIWKVERLVNDVHSVTLRLSGRIEAEHLSTLGELLEKEEGQVVFDLKEVTLVDREVVKRLSLYQARGTKFMNCPAYLREWMSKEST